jgi:hypothetical protein
MGTFTLTPPLHFINSSPIYMILFGTIISQYFSSVSLLVVDPVPLYSVYSNSLVVNQDPWVVPHPLEVGSLGSSMHLNVVDITYQDIQMTYVDLDQNLHHNVEYDYFTSTI